MKPITEERQQELIEFIGAAFDSMKGNEPVKSDRFDIEKMTQCVFEIALASLTAEPVAYTSGWDLSDTFTGGTAMMGKWNEVGTVPLYTAPPVPVIKLPDESNMPEKDVYYAGKNDGFNECLYEIKRLNNLE